MFSGGNSNGNSLNSFKQFGHFTTDGMHNTNVAAAAASINAQTTGSGGIDWGQLAQQWIHAQMGGDTNSATINAAAAAAASGLCLEQQTIGYNATTADVGGFNQQIYMSGMPVAPPPPMIGRMEAYQQQAITTTTTKPKDNFVEEQGEADMEMDEDAADSVDRRLAGTPPPAPHLTQSQWYTDGRQMATGSGNVAKSDMSSDMNRINKNHNTQWGMWPPRGNTLPGAGSHNATPIHGMQQNQMNPTAHIPSLLKIHVTNPNDTMHSDTINDMSGSGSSGIDANKRKLLPAWIREGLEKMEREKQKQLERQQPNSKETLDEKLTPQLAATATTPVNLMSLTNAASDSESGNEDVTNDDAPAVERNYVKSNKVRRQHTPDSELEDATRSSVSGTKTKPIQHNLIGKSYEQKLADLMSVVRRTLTELLLETTNEEIASVAQEALKAHRAKASSAQVIRKSALSSITNKLGLAAYADSSSDESSAASDNDDDKNSDRSNKEIDSEEELKNTIRIKRRAFAKTIEDIEERVAKAAEREEQQLKYHRQLEKEKAAEALKKQKREYGGDDYDGVRERRKDYERDFGETTSTTDTKLQQFNGKRLSRKERTTRFSDNKDGKSATLNATTNYLNQLQHATSASTSSSSGSGSSTSNNTKGSGSTTNTKKPVPNPATALLQMPDSVAHYSNTTTNTGMLSVMNAADAALEKASKSKNSSSSDSKKKRRERERRDDDRHSSSRSSRRRRGRDDDDDDGKSDSDDESDDSSNSSENSSDSEESSSSTSRYSKHSRASTTSSRRRDGQRRRDDKYYRSSSSRHSSSRHSHHNSSKYDRDRRGGSDRYYEKQRTSRRRQQSSGSEDSNYHTKRHESSSSSKHKRRERTRSRSRSRSTYSSSRSSHHHRRH